MEKLKRMKEAKEVKTVKHIWECEWKKLETTHFDGAKPSNRRMNTSGCTRPPKQKCSDWNALDTKSKFGDRS